MIRFVLLVGLLFAAALSFAEERNPPPQTAPRVVLPVIPRRVPSQHRRLRDVRSPLESVLSGELSEEISAEIIRERERTERMCESVLALVLNKRRATELTFQTQLDQSQAFINALELKHNEQRRELGEFASENRKALDEKLEKSFDEAREAVKEARDKTRKHLEERRKEFRDVLVKLFNEVRESQKEAAKGKDSSEQGENSEASDSGETDSGEPAIDKGTLMKMVMLAA